MRTTSLRWTALLGLLLSVAACGSKTPPAAGTGTPATAPSGTARATSEPGTAPPTVVAGTTASADAGAGQPAAAEVAPNGPGAEVAGAASDDAAPIALPADLPVVTGLAPEVVARALQGAPGCVGISQTGRAVLSIVESETDGATARELRYTDTATADRHSKDQGGWRFPAWEPEACGPKLREILAMPEVADLVKNHRFGPCHEVAGGAAVTIAKSVPIAVRENDDEISLGIEGNAPVTLAKSGDLGEVALEHVYWADEVGTVFLRVGKRDAGFDGELLLAIAPDDLGETECVPRPNGPKALVTDSVPAFEPAPASPSCVAMTADGKMAAFKIFRTGENAEPNHAVWFGSGTAPEIDLDCLVRPCKQDERDAVAASAAKLGLIGCHEARGNVAIDGWATPWMYKGNEVRLKGGSGWRVVHTLAMSAHDGGDHEQLWKVFQHPEGGPIFVYLGNSDTGLSESRVKVLDDAAMKLCTVPAEALRISEVKASSAAKSSGGYAFQAEQLVDGDTATSWQPAGKPNDVPTVELGLAEEKEVAAIEIANGFQRRDGNGDMFALNARGAEATLEFADGSVEKLTLTDERGLKRYDLKPRKTNHIKLTVTSLHAGSKWPKDLAISEIRLLAPPRP